jgi:hypothetical protein
MPQTLQAQECRERAMECARKAQESTDPLTRSMFAELAEQWAQLAEMLENSAASRTHRRNRLAPTELRALGLAISPYFLSGANEVIE